MSFGSDNGRMMDMAKRVILIVMDSFGIGEEPDAAAFGDEGTNTLRSCTKSEYFKAANLAKMGLLSIDGIECARELPEAGTVATGTYARLREKSMGKDTTIGHWEIAGLISPEPLPTYPQGFPPEVISAFEEKVGRGVLCNLPYSGTKVINDYGVLGNLHAVLTEPLACGAGCDSYMYKVTLLYVLAVQYAAERALQLPKTAY